VAYSRTWVESDPPDTQLASLLGQVARYLKTDIRERLFLSGPIASRPTPEAVFVGLVYIATDEGRTYRWNGTGWDAISLGALHLSSVVPVTITNPSVETDGLSVTIPAGLLSAGSLVRITARVDQTTGGTALARTYFGATIVGGGGTTDVAKFLMDTEVSVASPSSQFGSGVFYRTGAVYAYLTASAPAENVSGGIIVKTTSVAGTGVHVHQYLQVRVFA